MAFYACVVPNKPFPEVGSLKGDTEVYFLF